MYDPIRYYFLESYLFEDVNRRFHADHFINAFDFFSIVIWKANRAKSKIALKLLRKNPGQDLEIIVRNLTSSLYDAPSHEERMRLLIQDWSFALPMSSAILSVLWPDDFTIYDYRVCDQLGKFHDLYNLTDFKKFWEGYSEFKTSVMENAPNGLSLRDRDRYIWGKSAAEQLQEDIRKHFKKESERENTRDDEG